MCQWASRKIHLREPGRGVVFEGHCRRVPAQAGFLASFPVRPLARRDPGKAFQPVFSLGCKPEDQVRMVSQFR